MFSNPNAKLHAPYSDDELAAIAQRGAINSADDWRWLTTIANLKLQIKTLQESLARTKRGGRPMTDNPAPSTVRARMSRKQRAKTSKGE